MVTWVAEFQRRLFVRRSEVRTGTGLVFIVQDENRGGNADKAEGYNTCAVLEMGLAGQYFMACFKRSGDCCRPIRFERTRSRGFGYL